MRKEMAYAEPVHEPKEEEKQWCLAGPMIDKKKRLFSRRGAEKDFLYTSKGRSGLIVIASVRSKYVRKSLRLCASARENS
jgi:hypothetical protein